MKKINSNDYGYKVIVVGLVFAVLLPAIFKLLYDIFKYQLFNVLMWCCVGTAGLVLVGFFIFLKVELHQDKNLDEYYSAHRNMKIAFGSNQYECASCGNRYVKKQDTSCTVCGIRFHE